VWSSASSSAGAAPFSSAGAGAGASARAFSTSAGGAQSSESAQGSGAAGAGAGAGASAPSPQSTRLYRLTEDVKDVFAVAFGLDRKRNVEVEYDLGIREYPWVTYEVPAPAEEGEEAVEGKLARVYRNRVTGLVTDLKPVDFDQRAKPSAYITLNQEATGLAVLPEGANRSDWERRFDNLATSPIIQATLAAGRAVAASPVGAAVGKATEKVRSATDSVAERWETSQHP
jgi:hypothetical protein